MAHQGVIEQHEVKERPILFAAEMVRAILEGRKTQTRRVIAKQPHPSMTNIEGRMPARCPYGQPGDRLWVRETWAKPEPGVMTRNGDGAPIFKADYPPFTVTGFGPWKSGRFMPRKYCRLTLEITQIKVERLQEIAQEDAQAESFQCIAHFRALWDKINGKKHPWQSNPWVWVISFEMRRNV